MECPYCKKELKLPQHAYRNADTYDKTVVVVSNCCGRAFNLQPQRKWVVTPYTGIKTEDDWGEPIKKKGDPNYLKEDAPFLKCTKCGRKEYSKNPGLVCHFPQPSGENCKGILI